MPKRGAPVVPIELASFDPNAFLNRIETGKSIRGYGPGRTIFSQGDPADAVFYVQSGKVKITVISTQGKEAVVGLLEPGSFFGEGCLAAQALRVSAASAAQATRLVRVDKATMIRVLHEDREFAELFLAYLLTRNARIEADLVDQLFNSSEKRLARILLLMAHFGKESDPEIVLPKVSQDTLAAMVGTTRSRVSHFMTRFRKLGFIEYGKDLRVHRGLLSVVLHD